MYEILNIIRKWIFTALICWQWAEMSLFSFKPDNKSLPFPDIKSESCPLWLKFHNTLKHLQNIGFMAQRMIKACPNPVRTRV